MRSWGLKLVAPALLSLGALSFACGSMNDSSAFGDRNAPAGAGSENQSPRLGDKNGGSAAAPDLVPTDNGVIMVHAAGMPAFRLCFESDPQLKPQPDRDVMPNANVVGVEVGSAVRIAPLSGPPGRVWIFPEPSIRALSGRGDACETLINSAVKDYAYEMPAITTDFSKGVHLLVVRGCKGSGLTTYTKAECGEDYDETKAIGNLSIVHTELKGANRQGDELPTQVIHLSRAIETERGSTGTLSVSFGDVTTNDSEHASVASNPPFFGSPLALDKPPTFESTDEAVYSNVGFRVKLTPAGGGAATILAQQTLADVQAQSAPKELPSTYYSAASNYVLLLLGNPDPRYPDGGPNEDPLRKVHLLAVPVIDPKADAGASDAGSAPDGAN